MFDGINFKKASLSQKSIYTWRLFIAVLIIYIKQKVVMCHNGKIKIYILKFLIFTGRCCLYFFPSYFNTIYTRLLKVLSLGKLTDNI